MFFKIWEWAEMTLNPFEIVLIVLTGVACFFVYRFRQKLAEAIKEQRSLGERLESLQRDLTEAEETGESQQKDLQKQIDEFREEKQGLLLAKQELALEKKHFEESVGDKQKLVEQVEAQKGSLNEKIEALLLEKEGLAQRLNDLRVENAETVNAQSLSEQESKQSKDRSLDLERQIQALKTEKIQLGQEIKSLELKYDRLNQSHQAQKVTLQEQESSKALLKKDHQQAISDLESHQAEVLMRLEEEQAQALAEKKEEQDELKLSYEEKLSQLSQKADLDLREMKGSFEEKIAQLKAGSSEEIGELKSKYENDLFELKTSHEEEVKQAQIEHRDELSDLNKAYQASSEEQDVKYAELKARLEAELTEVKTEYHEKSSALIESYEEQLSGLKSKAESEYSDLESKSSDKITELSETLDQTQAELSTMKVAKSSLEEKLEFKVETLDQLKDDYHELEAEKKSYEELIETAAEGYSAPEVLRLKQELDQTLHDLSETSFQLESNRESLSSWINKTKLLNTELKEKSSRILDLESQLKQQSRELKRLSMNGTSVQEALVLHEEKSPYEVLRVSSDANFDEIKESYKSLMKQYNPHIVENMAEEIKDLATEACKEINQAYSELKKQFVTAK